MFLFVGANRNHGHFVIRVKKTHFLQKIEYANWSCYDKKDGVKVLQRQTPSFVGSIGLKKSQPKCKKVTKKLGNTQKTPS
jgi:hypothetical protein